MKKRGRPKKDLIDIIRTKAWYFAVEIKLQVSTPYAVEVIVEAENKAKKDAKFAGLRRWAAYKGGARIPQDIPGRLNPINMAEERALGTARWFRSPMWKALKGKLANKYGVEAALAESEAIAAIVFEYEALEFDDEYRQELGLDDSDPPPTYRRFNPDNINRCIELDGIDLLEAVILLLEFGSASGSLEITRPALELYKASSPKISAIPEIRAFLPEIFEAIEFKYTPDVNAQYDVFLPPWHVRLPDLYERICNIEALKEEALKPYESDVEQLER